MSCPCRPMAELLSRCLPCLPRTASSPHPLDAYLRERRIRASVISTGGQHCHTTGQAAEALGLEDDRRVVKTLVFMAGTGGAGEKRAKMRGEPFLVLVRGCDRVNRSLIEQSRGCRVRFSTPDEAEAVTGQKPGTISPLAALRLSLPVLMDAQVLDDPTAMCYVGTGTASEHLCISAEELRVAVAATVAPVAKAAALHQPWGASSQPRRAGGGVTPLDAAPTTPAAAVAAVAAVVPRTAAAAVGAASSCGAEAVTDERTRPSRPLCSAVEAVHRVGALA